MTRDPITVEQRPIAVVALGGNALLQRGEEPSADRQRTNARAAARAMESLLATHRLVVTHGNGPQVGLLALQADAYHDVEPYPLDLLGAETEGLIGIVLEQEIGNLAAHPATVSVLTQVVVRLDDPAFALPTKPIGPTYSLNTANQLADRRGWTMAPDGQYWRRVVPSPRPERVVEMPSIRHLVDAGIVVVCAGGGGVPVVAAPDGTLSGVSAVIDKDATAALLARELDADQLLILTDVDAVYEAWGTPQQRAIRRLPVTALDPASYPSGSMGPKLAAARDFVAATGRTAVIGRLDAAATMLAGVSGTSVTAEGQLTYWPQGGSNGSRRPGSEPRALSR